MITKPVLKLLPMNSASDIPEDARETPIGRLIEYQNFGRPFEEYTSAQLLVGMCMDHRKHLHMPDNFAFIIRTGGANLRYSEFKVSYAIAVGGVKHIALIGHDNCGMCGIADRRQAFIEGMVENAGWTEEAAVDHFLQNAPLFETGNEVEFLFSEAERLRRRYPKIQVMPMRYSIAEGRLFKIVE